MNCTGTRPMTRASIRAPVPHPLSSGVPKPWGIFDGDDGAEVEPRGRPEVSASNAHVDISSEDGSASVEDSTDDDVGHGN